MTRLGLWDLGYFCAGVCLNEVRRRSPAARLSARVE